MKRRPLGLLVGLALLAPPGPAAAGEERDCGGDAASSATVIEGRPSRRGPVTSVPDTLCADLAAPAPPVAVEVYVPILGGGVGGSGAGAPYEETPPRADAPPRAPRP